MVAAETSAELNALVGARVRIKSGPLAGYDGTVDAIQDRMLRVDLQGIVHIFTPPDDVDLLEAIPIDSSSLPRADDRFGA